MEPWRVLLCRSVVADSHPFDEEQDSDSDTYPHESEKSASK